ncbi:ADP-ribosylation factor family-domain-containing protein [Xylariaceae sp. FL0804]|nr:ADP-ribosylation factor family-domain-containing protein [Xylariaceae sp. FL0804]
MSSLLTKLSDYFWGIRRPRILMVGLDAAGKTTILYKLKLGEVVTTTPTITPNVETIQLWNTYFVIRDVGGHGENRPRWLDSVHEDGDVQGLIFVADSSDRDRLVEAREELELLLSGSDNKLRGLPLLVLANKMDLPNAMDTAEMRNKLIYENPLRPRDWEVQSTCATTGLGLYEGLEWLADTLRRRRRKAGRS